MDDHDFDIVETDNKQEVVDLARELVDEVLDDAAWSFQRIGDTRLIHDDDVKRIRKIVTSMAMMLKHYAERDAGVKHVRP